MPNLNQVNLIGHLTREVELRYTPKGTAVAEIGLAINRAWKDPAGAKKEDTVFLEVIAWARLGEICKEFLRSGDAVFFSGRLDMERWVEKGTNKNRSKMRVIAETMQLLEKKRSDSDAAPDLAEFTHPAEATL